MSNHQDLREMTKAFLNLTDEHVDLVQSNPKYVQIFEKAPQLINTDFIFEINEAHGCACQHRQGQKIKIR